jgi:acyl-coenzyme A thioesterase PaaI-like protein
MTHLTVSNHPPMARSIQDDYPENVAHCYGCGRLNEHGLQIKSYWDGEASFCAFRPHSYHIGFPGFVYGGLIASLIDCHACGTAAAAAYSRDGRTPDSGPVYRFVTGTLNVKYLLPTPIETDLELRATIREIKGRKVTVDVTLSANGKVRVTGEVICLEMPEEMVMG